MKIDGSLARNTPFEEEDFGVHWKTHRNTLIYFVATKEDRDVSYEMLVLRLCMSMSSLESLVLFWRLLMGEGAKPRIFEGFKRGCHAVLRGRRGTA